MIFPAIGFPVFCSHDANETSYLYYRLAIDYIDMIINVYCKGKNPAYITCLHPRCVLNSSTVFFFDGRAGAPYPNEVRSLLVNGDMDIEFEINTWLSLRVNLGQGIPFLSHGRVYYDPFLCRSQFLCTCLWEIR